MLEQIWMAVKPILLEFIKNPVFVSTVVLIVGAILSILKIPKWLSNIIINLIKNLFGAVEASEEKSKETDMTSEEKLAYAKQKLNETAKTKSEKTIIKTIGDKNLIEKVALPILQRYFKHKHK